MKRLKIFKEREMGLLKQCKGDMVHTRNITISTYERNEKSIIIEGKLKDKTLKSHHDLFSGEKLRPRTIHHLIIWMLVEGLSLNVKDIDVEMTQVPHKQCLETIKSLDKIKGLSITPGFTSEVKKIAGGSKGCMHLTTLLLAMAPAAIQGFWTHHARKSLSEDFTSSMKHNLIDSCRVWRRDGSMSKKLIQEVRENI
jgi:hypothetical protein